MAKKVLMPIIADDDEQLHVVPRVVCAQNILHTVLEIRAPTSLAIDQTLRASKKPLRWRQSKDKLNDHTKTAKESRRRDLVSKLKRRELSPFVRVIRQNSHKAQTNERHNHRAHCTTSRTFSIIDRRYPSQLTQTKNKETKQTTTKEKTGKKEETRKLRLTQSNNAKPKTKQKQKHCYNNNSNHDGRSNLDTCIRDHVYWCT